MEDNSKESETEPPSLGVTPDCSEIECPELPNANHLAVPDRRPLKQRKKQTTHLSSTQGDSDGYSSCSVAWEEETWSAINDRRVSQITLDFFYKPRTLTLLAALTGCLMYVAFLRDDSTSGNIVAGLLGTSFLFLTVGLLIFPNGPFTRPHPAIWSLVFGLSFLYLLLIMFLLFQSYTDVMAMLHYIDPSLKQAEVDSHANISMRRCEISIDNLWEHCDVFVPGHIIGWMYKAMLVRHYGMLWTISLMWEVTEVFFAHILPNFYECWWDMLVLDFLVCNGLGIYIGMGLIHHFEVRPFHWESIKQIKGARGKIKRAALQFTPLEWSRTRWLDPTNIYQRALAVFLLILMFQITELNSFLTKHVLYIPSSHHLVVIRLVLVGLIGAPSIRQYYIYVTDKTCRRLGNQIWLFLAIMVTELLLSIKFGIAILPRPTLIYMACWLGVIGLLSIILTIVMVTYTSPKWVWSNIKNVKKQVRRKRVKKRQTKDGIEGCSD